MDIIALIDTLAWPVTLLIILFGFRKYVSKTINRLGSIDAGASGISLTFANQIQDAKEQILQIKGGTISKSSRMPLGQSTNKAAALRTLLDSKISNFAGSNALKSISTTDKVNELKEVGIISLETAQVINVIENLISKASAVDMNKDQYDEISQLIKDLTP